MLTGCCSVALIIHVLWQLLRVALPHEFPPLAVICTSVVININILLLGSAVAEWRRDSRQAGRASLRSVQFMRMLGKGPVPYAHVGSVSML